MNEWTLQTRAMQEKRHFKCLYKAVSRYILKQR